MKFAVPALLSSVSLLAACASVPAAPIPPASLVDLARFMGPWYVIASIPTFLEKDAFGAIESYSRNADGTIATTFTFHKGSFDGPLKTMKPRGFVSAQNTAVWGMEFIWPFKAQYVIAYVDPEYSETIIARDKRDYVWIMARKPQLTPDRYQQLVNRVGQMGYDVTKLRRVPQRADDVTP